MTLRGQNTMAQIRTEKRNVVHRPATNEGPEVCSGPFGV